MEVEHIIVLGYARCGGVRSLFEVQRDRDESDFIASWLSIADEARKRTMARNDLQTLDEWARVCELEAIEISLANLEAFPWIRESVAKNRLQLHGWYCDMKSGDLLNLDSNGSGFISF